MPSNPKQDFAISIANGYQSVAVQISNLVNQARALQLQSNKEGVSATLENFATQAVNADGSLGTADGSPNTAHPMTALGFSWSAFNGMDIAITQLLNLWNNVAVGQIDMQQYCTDIQAGK